MCTGGKDGKKGDDRCIVRELYERILIGKILRARRRFKSMNIGLASDEGHGE